MMSARTREITLTVNGTAHRTTAAPTIRLLDYTFPRPNNIPTLATQAGGDGERG